MHEREKWKWSHSVIFDPQRPHGLQPTRVLHPWDFPGRSTGVGCHCLLRRSFYFCVKVPEDWLLCPANDMGRRTLKTRRGSVPSGALAQTLMGSTGTCFHSSTYSKQNWVRVQSLEAYQTLLESTSLTWWGCQSQFFSSVRLNISLPRWASRYRKSGTSSMGIVGQSFSSQAFSTKLTAWLLPTQLQ